MKEELIITRTTTTMAEDEHLQWSVDMEVSLFYAMRRHKPVGVNRHFQMVCIHNKLNSSLSKKISSKQIWTKLSSMYDLQALNESEIIPFPNADHDFDLPDSEYKDPRDQPFPRTKKTASNAGADDTGKDVSKDQGKDSSKEHSKESTSKSKASATEKISDRLADASKSDDSPKREHRKRTRQAVQSPATDATPPTTKRARRL